jgi:hypothetical protein
MLTPIRGQAALSAAGEQAQNLENQRLGAAVLS